MLVVTLIRFIIIFIIVFYSKNVIVSQINLFFACLFSAKGLSFMECLALRFLDCFFFFKASEGFLCQSDVCVNVYYIDKSDIETDTKFRCRVQ